MTLHAKAVDFNAGGRALLRQVSLEIRPGSLHAILGPNGAGKSTLLRLLCGEIQPSSGTVELASRRLKDWPIAALAQQRAVLPQQDELDFGFRVEEVVALGRLPCPRQKPVAERELLQQALQSTGAAHLWGRAYPSLSGGERRRVQLARVLAQVWEPLTTGPRYLLLDEPTASLDLAHQHGCLAAARRFADHGNGVAAILHDPNLALAHADTVTLLLDGAVLASGAPSDVLTASHLASAYSIEAELLQPDGWPHPWIATRPVHR